MRTAQEMESAVIGKATEDEDFSVAVVQRSEGGNPMRAAYRIVIAAVLVAALAACTKGPGGAAPAVSALIGTWQVTSYVDEDGDMTEDRKITLTITATTYTERYDPPFEFEVPNEEEEAEVGMQAFSASYVADAERKVLTLSAIEFDFVGEDSDLYERFVNLLLADYPETLEYSYSFPEPDQLRLEVSNGTIIARRM